MINMLKVQTSVISRPIRASRGEVSRKDPFVRDTEQRILDAALEVSESAAIGVPRSTTWR